MQCIYKACIRYIETLPLLKLPRIEYSSKGSTIRSTKFV